MPKVRDLLDLPDRIRKMDFTVTLTDGVAKPEQTVEQYVVTPTLVDCFDQSLGLIGGAITDGRSQGTYLHGSFGSGKSHFMAMTSLLVAGNEHAWRIPALHPLRAKLDWVGKAKILELHLHMLGQHSLETAIFPAYLAYLAKHHPTAPLPPIFADEELFENAAELLDKLGDTAFFGPMNAAARTTPPPATTPASTPSDAADEDEDWGEVASADTWDRPRFDAARTSTNPTDRANLLSALITSHFRAYRSTTSNFKDIDLGLFELSRHAHALGYDAIVLFLDELVLALAMKAADPAWLGHMVESMVKLVDSTHSARPAPIVSFIARQRALQEMVGDKLAGADNRRLQEALDLAKGRFGTINIPDESLPAIVEKRVLRPKDAAAATALQQAFDGLRTTAEAAWNTLLGGKYDGNDFRRVYPFSPALIETLVALSSSLQRQRTAIKLLTELLVEHIEDLELGQLVGVGDLFDVLASGDESADGMMRERFKAAKHLYKHELLPLIQETHGTGTPEKCQRERGEQVRLGCANCPQLACRNDNRLVKTLLVAALVPEVRPLRGLTARRLVELNHGKLKSPVPGYEARQATERLKKYASHLGQIHVGGQADPTVSIELLGVDIRPIMEMAREHENPGRREALMRDILFEAMGLPGLVDGGVDQPATWRHTKRQGHVRFGNVRKMGPEALRCPEGHDWRLVIDYPFDAPGHGPADDERVLDTFLEEHGGTWTLVWLPSFFSEAINNLVKELVILNHVLDTNPATTRKYLQHLSLEQQDLAHTSLRNLQSQKRAQVEEAMLTAYGLRPAKDDDPRLDPQHRVERHLRVLQPGITVRPNLALQLSDALTRYVPELLDARFPNHPELDMALTKKTVGIAMQRFGELCDADDKKVVLEKEDLAVMRGIMYPLGLVRMSETAAHLRADGPLQELEKRRMQKQLEVPSAGQVARWYDESGTVGLLPEAEAVVVRAYARAYARTLVRFGEPYAPADGKGMPDDVMLEKPALPDPAPWMAAIERAGELFGIGLPGRARNGDNLKSFESLVRERLQAQGEAAVALPAALGRWYRALGVDEETDRLVTARCGAALVAALQGQPAMRTVEVLAAFDPRTSGRAVGRSLARAPVTRKSLDNGLALGVFQQLLAKAPSEPAAAELLEQARRALRQDELNEALAERLPQLAHQGQALLTPEPSFDSPVGSSAPTPPPPSQILVDVALRADGRTAILAALETLLADVRAALNDDSGTLSLRGRVTLTREDE